VIGSKSKTVRNIEKLVERGANPQIYNYYDLNSLDLMRDD